jgi:hypothetical protein
MIKNGLSLKSRHTWTSVMNIKIRHRSGLIYDKNTNHHRTVLAYMAGAATLVGAFIGDVFHIYMLYQLYWRWFGYMSPSYCTTWPSLVLARFRFLLDHVSDPYCSTHQFSIGTHVVLRLGHVSLLHWTMCRSFIGPHGMTIIPCMSFFYSTTCHDVVHLHVSILLSHISHPELPTHFFYSTTWQDRFVPHIWFVLAHMSYPSTYTCHLLVCPCVIF